MTKKQLILLAILFTFQTFSNALAEPVLPLEQPSPDMTIVKATVENTSVTFEKGKMWIGDREITCSVDREDSMDKVYNCTEQLQNTLQKPVWMPITFRNSNFFKCQVLNVMTVSRRLALDAANFIGFWYRPNTPFSKTVLNHRNKVMEWMVPTKDLKTMGETKMINALNGAVEDGVLHEWSGLVGCWEGTAELTLRWQVEVRPYMGFLDERARKLYKNYDMTGPYRVSLQTGGFDRSKDVLR